MVLLFLHHGLPCCRRNHALQSHVVISGFGVKPKSFNQVLDTLLGYSLIIADLNDCFMKSLGIGWHAGELHLSVKVFSQIGFLHEVLLQHEIVHQVCNLPRVM